MILIVRFDNPYCVVSITNAPLYNLQIVYKVVVPIPNLYLVSCLSMHCVHFKYIGDCVSRLVIVHASHGKVLGLGTTTLM
jgi:hypothetical protein